MMDTKACTAMAAPPPPIISSTPAPRWPLRNPAKSMPPMHYLRMEELTALRRKSAAASPNGTEWMDDVPGALSALSLFDDDDESPPGPGRLRRDYALLSLSVLLLGHGRADEAHALATPYSWPEEVHTSYGPVRYGTSDPGVVSAATYVHALVHRREGRNVGEFGMAGWANADYWGSAWRRPFLRSEELQRVWKETIGDMRRQIRSLAEDHPAGKDWCDEHLPEPADDESISDLEWDPRALSKLCAQVTKNDSKDVSEDLLTFTEKAVESELRVLLSHCTRLAGYSQPQQK